MRVLVTGGAGCIGSDLVAALLDRGDVVTVLDNLSSGKIEHIRPFRQNSRFTFLEGDLLDISALDGACRGNEFVFHLAANPDVKFCDGDPTDKDLKQNVLATYNVLETMRLHGIRDLAFASTSAVYGIPDSLPIPENAPFPKPISLYGATKLACEALISAFGNLLSFRYWIFRFANIVGPKSRAKGRTVISDFLFRLQSDPSRLLILGNGRQAKSYLLSTECVDAMLYVVDHAPGGGSILNLGCSDWITVDRIAQLVVDAMGLKDVRFEYTGTEGGWPGDVPRFRLDVAALNSLGWTAVHNSEEAVKAAIRAALPQRSDS